MSAAGLTAPTHSISTASVGLRVYARAHACTLPLGKGAPPKHSAGSRARNGFGYLQAGRTAIRGGGARGTATARRPLQPPPGAPHPPPPPPPPQAAAAATALPAPSATGPNAPANSPRPPVLRSPARSSNARSRCTRSGARHKHRSRRDCRACECPREAALFLITSPLKLPKAATNWKHN